jgi:uncharacterized membrane protein YdjX (TVP38/TMEM64 family)
MLRQMGPKLLIRSAVLIILLITAGLLVNHYRFEEFVEWFQFASDDSAGWLNGRFAFACLSALFTAAGGPRQVAGFFAAYFFGFLPGFLIALFSTLAGCMIALTTAMFLGGHLRKLIRGQFDNALQIWAKNAFGFTMLIRLLPVGSNLVTNLAAGVAGIPVFGFLAGSLIGYIPQTLIFALMGAGVNVGSGVQITVSIGLFLLSIVLGVWILDRYQKRIKKERRKHR